MSSLSSAAGLRSVAGRAALLVVGAVAVGLLLAGCGDGEPSITTTATASPTATAEPTATSTATAAGTPAPDDGGGMPFTANTEPDTGEASAPMIAVTDVEMSTHQGYDRVAFEIGGEGQAGWEVRYVDQPTSQGTGEEVRVAGGAVLEVAITNVGLPFDIEPTPLEGDPRVPAALQTVREVVNDTIFEGRHVFFVGVGERTPFRVRRGDGGAVVLEVVHPG